jgi:RNA polymerase sigma-70 factor (ECF subfamily)
MTSAKVVEFQPSAWEQDHARDRVASELILDLYDREQIAIRRYLIFLSIDVETATEIVQESFLRLHQHLQAGGDRSHLRAWLYRVAHNLARNTQTSSRVNKTGPLEESTAGLQAVDRRISAEARLLAREEEERMQKALYKLSPPQRSCLLLRSQGLKYREIADALSLSVSTVGEHIQRGLERLKEAL